MSELLSSLEVLGLSEYESKAVLALFEYESMKASELAAKSGVPRGKIYAVLSLLSNKGLVGVSGDKVNKYFLLNFESVMSRIVDSKLTSLQAARDKVLSERERLLANRGDSTMKIGQLIRKTDAGIEKLGDLIESSKNTVYLSFFPTWLVEKLTTSLKIAKDNGNTVRWLLPQSELNTSSIKKLKSVVEVRRARDKMNPLIATLDIDARVSADIFFEGEKIMVYEIEGLRWAQYANESSIECWARSSKV